MNIRCDIDKRDFTPGYKFNDWEMKGVPLRFEIGNKELSDKSITLALRTQKKKIKIKYENLNDVYNYLNAVNNDIRNSSKKFFDDNLIFIDSLDKINEDKMVKLYWCGSRECSDRIESISEKAVLGNVYGDNSSGKCMICGREGKLSVFSRTY